MDWERAPQAYPNELLISLQRGDVESSLPFHVRPVQDFGVPVDVHASHTEGSTEEVLVREAIGMWGGRWRTGTSEQDEDGVVLRVLSIVQSHRT